MPEKRKPAGAAGFRAAGAAAALLVLGALGVAALAHKPAAPVDKKPPPPASPLVALVGEEGLSRADILQQQALMTSHEDSPPPTRRTALEALVRDVILAAEARRRGLGLDEAAAADLASSHRRLYAQGLLPDEEDIRDLIASLRSVGVSEDRYWRELAPRFYRRAYAVAALGSVEGERVERLYLRLRRESGVVIFDEAFLREDGGK